MFRFLMFVRDCFNKRKLLILSFFITLFALLYFVSYAIFDTGGNGVFGFFTSMLSFSDMLQYVKSGEASMFDVVFYRIFPLALFIIAIVGTCLAYKTNFLLACSLPFSIYAIVIPAQNLRFSAYVPSWHAYAAIYILFATLLIAATITLLLALYLPLKAHEPRPPRERKPTKAERIAELERQVAELKEKEKDAELRPLFSLILRQTHSK